MKRLLAVALLVLLLIVVACSSEGGETTSPTSPPQRESQEETYPYPAPDFLAPTPNPDAYPYPSPESRLLPASVTTEAVRFRTADGVELAALWYPPRQAPAPTMLLLHMVGGRKEDWRPLAEQLHAAGYGVLALDFRGHGESGGDVDWQATSADVEAAVAFLRARTDVDSQRLFLIGASIGANLALRFAAENPSLVRGIVLLSPGLEYHGLRTTEAAAAYTGPMLIVATEGDAYAAESSLELGRMAANAEVLILPGRAHGTRMFATDLAIEPRILVWLADRMA